MAHMRGQPVAVEYSNTTDTMEYAMIAGATMCEAIQAHHRVAFAPTTALLATHRWELREEEEREIKHCSILYKLHRFSRSSGPLVNLIQLLLVGPATLHKVP